MSSNVRVTGSRGHFDFLFDRLTRREKFDYFFKVKKSKESEWIFIFQISSENERGTQKENDDDDDCNAPFSFCFPRMPPTGTSLAMSTAII
jgi:hypothetical protein